MRPRTRRSVIVVVVLSALWVAIIGELTRGTVLTGVAVAVGLRALLAGTEGPNPSRSRVRVLPAARFLATAVVDLVKGAMSVAHTAVTPTRRTRPALLHVPMRPSSSPSVLTAVAHAISASPGSVTVRVRDQPPALDVHVLRLDDASAVRRHVQELERLAATALGYPVDDPPQTGPEAT